MFNKLGHCVLLFLTIKYWQIFNISDLSKVLLTEKPYTFPFNNNYPESISSNLIDNLSWQNWVGKLQFMLSALNWYIFSINKK